MKAKLASVACVCASITTSLCSGADLQLSERTALHFASAAEGSKILMSADDFTRRLSPFDRAARLKVDHPVSDEDFLSFVGKNVSDWTDDEIRSVQAAVENLRPLLGEFSLSLPSTIQLIKTTGAEEGNAAYTRGTAIIFPKKEFARDEREMEKLICHELFHVLSRTDPDLRERLYAAIGFNHCDEIEFPPALAPRKITNPDAPRNDHFIRLTTNGQECLAVPILFSTTERYNVERGGEFFVYLNFQFLVMEKTAKAGQLKTQDENGKPKLLGPQQVGGFFEQVGRNTEYIIHPEEILADNFALLVLKEEKVSSPQILQKMKQILGGTKP